jgi:hypothetical protein
MIPTSILIGFAMVMSWVYVGTNRNILSGFMMLAAPIFSGGKIQLWLRWPMVSYGVLGLTSAILYLIGSPLAAIGFVAWGLIVFVITGLLTVYFKQH